MRWCRVGKSWLRFHVDDGCGEERRGDQIEVIDAMMRERSDTIPYRIVDEVGESGDGRRGGGENGCGCCGKEG